jgi:hypothetical protein
LLLENVSAPIGIIVHNSLVSAIYIALSGVSVNELVNTYGAPVVVIDDDTISIDLAYPTEGMVFTVRENNPNFVFGVRIVNEETVNRAWINARHTVGDYFPCSDSSQLCAVSTATPSP